jgi:hypothetical protein
MWGNMKVPSKVWPTVVAMLVLPLMAAPIDARQFANSYVSFDLPDDWTCGLEGTEWVCTPPPVTNGKYAMIAILTAKCVGLEDSPQLYKQHLIDAGKADGVAVVQAPRDTMIGSVLWIDASLRNSEVKGYTTRYLARTEGNIGVLITFSAHHSVGDKANSTSDLMASSVLVNTQTAFLNNHSYQADADQCPQSK